MDVLYSSNPGRLQHERRLEHRPHVAFNPQLLQFDMTARRSGGASRCSMSSETWPIINQMLYPAMIVQSGQQVYGGNPAHQYLCYPGGRALPDSQHPNRDGLLRGAD